MRIKIYPGRLVCFFLFAIPKLDAQQTAKDSSMRASAITSAIQVYQDYISFAAPLYAGPQYTDYYLKMHEGHPFYINTNFHKGSVLYDNMLYDNIKMKYDILQNRLVLQDGSGVFRLVPDYGKIQSFTIEDHDFIKLVKDSSNPGLPRSGFYEIVYTGKHVTLLKKESKQVVEDMGNRTVLQRSIISDLNFYVRIGNTYHVINKKKHVLDLFKDKKNEIRQFIRKKSLDFKEDVHNSMLSVVAYYDSLL